MKRPLLAACLLGLTVPALHAQLDDTDPPYQAICRAALAKPFTPPAPDPALKPDCDSTSFYFGIGRPVDYAAARSCALVEYAQTDAADATNIFSGAGVLSMIYANGQGAPVDLDLAIRFTCEKWAAPEEIESRLDVLTAARDNHTPASFDLCETATSGNAEGWCTSVEARLSEIDRNQKLQQFQAKLPAAAADSFANLQKAEDDFLKLHADNELALSGTNRRAIQLVDDNDLRDQFLTDLQLVTAPGFHQEVAFKAADKQLSAAYKPVRIGAAKSAIPRAPKTLPSTPITFRGVEETQQSWLHLRDAWTAFARTANPESNADKQAASLVTIERTKQLNQLTHPPLPNVN